MESRTLVKKIAKLPDELKLKVEKYVDDLVDEAKNSSTLKSDIKQNNRGFGSLKDKIWMAEDFNSPLEDFKDYM
jgi:hypothetical protein